MTSSEVCRLGRALICFAAADGLPFGRVAAQAALPPVLETGGQHPMPLEWIDSETGHRVRKLVQREGSNTSFYFTNPAFVPRRADAGGQMVFKGTTAKGRQLFVVDLATLVTRQLTDRTGGVGGEILVPATGDAFYQSHDSVFSVNVVTGVSRLVMAMPSGMHGSISTVNADATVIAGVTAGPEAAEIRTAVFVREQGVPQGMEWDGQDAQAFHAVARNGLGQVVATARLIDLNGAGRIGRMAVHRGLRGRHIGQAILGTLVNAARQRGNAEVQLHAQRSAEGFYRRQGFSARGEPFEEAGIAHIKMAISL